MMSQSRIIKIDDIDTASMVHSDNSDTSIHLVSRPTTPHDVVTQQLQMQRVAYNPPIKVQAKTRE